jgi:carboxyl-terminal processing protease
MTSTHAKAAVALAMCLVAVLPASGAEGHAGPVPCAEPSQPPGKLGTTTISTIEQAYSCVFAHYYGGAKLDDRVLLTAAFTGFARELDRRGRDVPDAMMPALTGDRRSDWAAFSAVYQRVTSRLPADEKLRQALAAAAVTAMVSALHDNHAKWDRVEMHPDAEPSKEYGLGLVTSPFMGLLRGAPQQATPPLYVGSVNGGPAAAKGLRPGDVIESVNGAPPFAGGILSAGTVKPLLQDYPDDDPVRLGLRRPSTGRTWTVTLKPTLFKVNPKAMEMLTSKVVAGDVAYVRLVGFGMRAADQVLKAISDMGKGRKLRGVVLDLRSNRGGAPDEAARLLSAFVHGKVTAYQCDVDGACESDPTVDSVPLLNLPLVVLTDGSCASACDHFTAAVKDLHAGTLVGTRTAGVVSGPARPYLLDDNSALFLPERHHLGPNHEVINGSGVAPDHYARLTAKDVSTGKDPVLAKALTLFP